MGYHVTVEGQILVVDISNEGVSVLGQRIAAKLEAVPDSPARSLLLDNALYRLVARGAAVDDGILASAGSSCRLK
jgi:hypothetical protein